jgi:hypothetical protein
MKQSRAYPLSTWCPRLQNGRGTMRVTISSGLLAARRHRLSCFRRPSSLRRRCSRAPTACSTSEAVSADGGRASVDRGHAASVVWQSLAMFCLSCLSCLPPRRRQNFLVLCSMVGRREDEGGGGGYFVGQRGATGSAQKISEGGGLGFS